MLKTKENPDGQIPFVEHDCHALTVFFNERNAVKLVLTNFSNAKYLAY